MHAALNLAYHMGARNVCLLGLDMRIAPDGRTHWHDGHPVGRMRADTLRDKMLPYFDALAEALAEQGMRVVNASPGSAVRCWPVITHAEAFGRAPAREAA